MRQHFISPKRGLALLLSLVLLVSALSVGGVSAAGDVCTCGEIPRVYIEGLGAALYLNEDTPEQSEVSMIETEGLQDLILPIAQNIIKAAAMQDWDAGADAISVLVWGMAGHLQCNEAGESVEPISNHYNPIAQDHNHKENNKFKFRYDWRLDPMQSARELNEYIALVQEATGHEKVALLYHSEGGMIATAYISQFGFDALDHMIAIASAHNGMSLAGELLNKTASFNATGAANLLRSYAGEEGGMGLVSSLVTVLEQAGMIYALCDALQILWDNTKDRLYETTITPLFAQWPAFWGFVPDSYYESAKSAVLDSEIHEELINKIDDYHYNAGARADELLTEAAQAGVKVSIIAAYGYPIAPVFATSNLCADGVIDTALESSGATCADYGTTLPEDYTQQNADGHGHISPNRQIDASTCVFPEQTWFLRDAQHSSPSADDLCDFLVYSDGQPTVHQNADFPQFLLRTQEGVLVPDSPTQTEELPDTLSGAIWQLLIKTMLLLIETVGGIS